MTAEREIDRQRRRAVDHAVDHILNDVTGPLDLTALAAVSGYSPWHLQRVFTAVMGESPSVFVARARVERAVAIARAEPHRVWRDIAGDSGFATPAQLSRAFRQRFGRPARSWDRSAPLVDRTLQPGHSDAPIDSTHKNENAAFAVHIEQVPSCRFAYRRVREPYAPGNLSAAWDVVDGWRSAISLPSPMLGMSWDDPATVPLEQCRYDLGIALVPTVQLPAGSSERWMPSTTAAVIHVDGDIATVDAAWEHLHRVWLPSSPRRRSALPSIERFHADPRPAWDRWCLDCIVPIGPIR